MLDLVSFRCSTQFRSGGRVSSTRRTSAFVLVVLLSACVLTCAAASGRHAVGGGFLATSASSLALPFGPTRAARFSGFTLPLVAGCTGPAYGSSTVDRVSNHRVVPIPQASRLAIRLFRQARQKSRSNLLPAVFGASRFIMNSKRASPGRNPLAERPGLGLPWGTGPPRTRAGFALPSSLSRLTPSVQSFADIIFQGNPTEVGRFYVNSSAACAAHAKIASTRVVGQPGLLVRIVRDHCCQACLWNDFRQREG